MTAFVVDTNVPIVANGCAPQADCQCRERCVEKLGYLIEQGTVAIDDKDAILQEYTNNFSRSGRGMGDLFFIHVTRHLYDEARVQRAAVTPIDDERRSFGELPENTFDRSDRKFLAVAVSADAVVLNAADSDWGEQKELMDTLGVEVEQLCPQHASKGA